MAGERAKFLDKHSANSSMSALRSSVMQIGASAVHALMPDEYEYYLCALELLNSEGVREGFISFVVMPDQISETHTPIQSITKTHNGIVTTFNPSFAPVDISISGTFGRKFRLVAGLKDPSKKNSIGLGFNTGSLLGGVGAKSGYGLMKVLEHILIKSEKTDVLGKPYFVVFHNYTFNTKYVVNIMNYSFHQSYDQNMIWYYSINMKAVSEKGIGNLKTRMAETLKTVSANSIASGMSKIITSVINF